MAAVNLSDFFSLPPFEAISFLRSKGYAITFNWRDMWKEAHSRAFTVAGVLKMDILQDIRHALESAAEQGTTGRQFAEVLQTTLEQKGWWGKGLIVDRATGEISGKKLNPTRLDLIFKTNTQSALMAGRYQQFMENREDRPYFMYVAIDDDHTRQAHRLFNGRIYRYDDPIWQYIWPPNGFNCRCSVRALSEDDIKRLGLTVLSSEGRIKFEEREIATDDIQQIMYYDDPVFDKVYITDIGFDYNSGRIAYQPDLSQYPSELVAQYQQEISNNNVN